MGLAWSARVVFLQLSVESPLADAQNPGGFFAVASLDLEGLGDVVSLDLVHRPAEQRHRAAGGGFGRGRNALQVFGEVIDIEYAVRVDDHHALDRVLQLTNIP